MPNDSVSKTPKPFVFVLMPLDSSFNDVYKFGIKGAAEAAGAHAERVDEQIFTEGILDRIYNQINKADVVVAVMTGRNPNVFYEVGYAHALGKTVLLLTERTDDIPFDLKHRQHTIYEGSIDKLVEELTPKLAWAIEESKKGNSGVFADRFCITLFNTKIDADQDLDHSPEVSVFVEGNKDFHIPICIRNDSRDRTPEISHLYLLTTEKAVAVPCYTPSPSFGKGVSWPPQTARPEPMWPLFAEPINPIGDLIAAYRLQLTIPPLPPGALEQLYLHLILRTDDPETLSRMSLRIHSPLSLHDYHFNLKAHYSPKNSD